MRRALLPRILPVAILAGVIIALMAPPRAVAQHAEQLTRYLERTAEIIEWATDQVLAVESQQARRVLDEARRLHQRALGLADQGNRAAALGVSRRARDAAQHAVRLAREARGNEERAQLRLERFLEYRDQILDRAREAGDERALRFVREAELQAARARDQYNQGNVDLALSLLEAAEDLLGRAARLLFEGGGAERLEREIERTRQAIERIAERVRDASDAVADDLLQSARVALSRAEDFAARGQPMRALQSLRLARRLAGRAASVTRDGLDAETVTAQLERWDQRHERVAERVADSGSDLAAETLARAREHRDRAASLLADRELEPALRQLKAAFDLLNEADEMTR